MARAGIVDRDPVGRFQAGAQHLAGLRQKVVLPIDQQAHELTLGNADPNRLKLRDQALDRHLTLVILHQYEATQLWAKMAANAARQRRHDRLALRRQPALSAIAYHSRCQHQLLHLVGLVTFELRTPRMRTRNTSVSGTTRDVTLPRRRRLTRLPPRFNPVAFSIPLGLIDGRPLRPFSRAISSRCTSTICFSSATSPSSSTNRASSSARGKSERLAVGGIPQPSLTARVGASGKIKATPGLCPDYCQRCSRVILTGCGRPGLHLI